MYIFLHVYHFNVGVLNSSNLILLRIVKNFISYFRARILGVFNQKTKKGLMQFYIFLQSFEEINL